MFETAAVGGDTKLMMLLQEMQEGFDSKLWNVDSEITEWKWVDIELQNTIKFLSQRLDEMPDPRELIA